MGRTLQEVGAHVEGHNATSIGICMIGTGKFTKAAWLKLKETVQELSAKFPKAKIVGHRDLSPDKNKDGKITPNEWVKLCPSFDVATWIAGGMEPLKGHLV